MPRPVYTSLEESQKAGQHVVEIFRWKISTTTPDMFRHTKKIPQNTGAPCRDLRMETSTTAVQSAVSLATSLGHANELRRTIALFK